MRIGEGHRGEVSATREGLFDAEGSIELRRPGSPALFAALDGPLGPLLRGELAGFGHAPLGSNGPDSGDAELGTLLDKIALSMGLAHRDRKHDAVSQVEFDVFDVCDFDADCVTFDRADRSAADRAAPVEEFDGIADVGTKHGAGVVGLLRRERDASRLNSCHMKPRRSHGQIIRGDSVDGAPSYIAGRDSRTSGVHQPRACACGSYGFGVFSGMALGRRIGA